MLCKRVCGLKEVQKLHGKLNDIGRMSDFLKGFCFHVLRLMAKFRGNEKTVRFVTKDLKNDLSVWRAAVKGTGTGLPISDPERGPALTSLVFVSDAAGAATS